jgi:hypothetical protein
MPRFDSNLEIAAPKKQSQPQLEVALSHETP